MALPAYPLQALGNGTALVEAAVDVDGPAAVRVLTASASVFGDAALAAAQQWRSPSVGRRRADPGSVRPKNLRHSPPGT